MGTNFRELLKGLLIHNKKPLDCFEQPNIIQAKLAYNEGLRSIEEFLRYYDNGDVGKDFIDLLIKASQEK